MTDTFDPDDEFEQFDPESFDPYENLPDLTIEETSGTPDEPQAPLTTPPRSPLLTGLIVLLLLVVASIAAFQFLRDDDEDPEEAAPVTTTSLANEAPTESTVPGDTPTTVATETTVTTVDVPTDTFISYEPFGEPIPLGELKLAVDAIGPIILGSRAEESVGMLVASLGPPDEDTGPVISTGAYGACEGSLERILRFGALRVIVLIDDDGTQTFAGYRLDLAYGGLSSDAVGLQTLSGLGAGNSVRQLEQIYKSFTVEFLTDSVLGDIYELRSKNTGNLLLWGPVSSPDAEGFVRGIYAPDACGRF